MDEAKEVLEAIIKALVNTPAAVEVTKSVDEMGVLFVVKVEEGEAGLVIGKGGNTINAVRAVLSIVGAKNRARISIKLDVPDTRKQPGDVDL